MGSKPSVSTEANFTYDYNPLTGIGSLRLVNGWNNISYDTLNGNQIEIQIPETFGTITDLFLTVQSDANGSRNIYWITRAIQGRFISVYFVTLAGPNPILFNTIARTKSASFNMKLGVSSTPPTYDAQVSTFNFNYVQSKALSSINSDVDQSGVITYGDKLATESNLEELNIVELNGLSNATGYYRLDVTIHNGKLTYDTIYAPNVAFVTLQNGIIVVTCNVSTSNLFINSNVNSSLLDVPGTMQINTVSNGNMLYVNPVGGSFNNMNLSISFLANRFSA